MGRGEAMTSEMLVVASSASRMNPELYQNVLLVVNYFKFALIFASMELVKSETRICCVYVGCNTNFILLRANLEQVHNK